MSRGDVSDSLRPMDATGGVPTILYPQRRISHAARPIDDPLDAYLRQTRQVRVRVSLLRTDHPHDAQRGEPPRSTQEHRAAAWSGAAAAEESGNRGPGLESLFAAPALPVVRRGVG